MGGTTTEKRPWSDEEYGFLADHPEWTARQIGDALGRGMQSVQHKRNQLRDGWTPVKEPWSEEDVDFVRATPHLTALQVARHLGRTESAITNRRHFLIRMEGLTFDGGKGPHDVAGRRLLAKTCLGCGLVLDASWFGLMRFKGRTATWNSRCVRCKNANASPEATENRRRYGRERQRRTNDARRSEAKYQALSLPHAHRNREPWLSADEAILRDPDLLVIEKAIALGRTYKATMHKCSKEGFVSKVGRGDPVKGQWVIFNPNVPTLEAEAS